MIKCPPEEITDPEDYFEPKEKEKKSCRKRRNEYPYNLGKKKSYEKELRENDKRNKEALKEIEKERQEALAYYSIENDEPLREYLEAHPEDRHFKKLAAILGE